MIFGWFWEGFWECFGAKTNGKNILIFGIVFKTVFYGIGWLLGAILGAGWVRVGYGMGAGCRPAIPLASLGLPWSPFGFLLVSFWPRFGFHWPPFGLAVVSIGLLLASFCISFGVLRPFYSLFGLAEAFLTFSISPWPFFGLA